MGYFCPKCYAVSYTTVRLVKDGDTYICVRNPEHVFELDSQGFPRRKKD